MDGEIAESLAFVVHELRSPLGYVATAAHLISEESGDDAVRSRCRAIQRTAERMLRTTETILNATRVIRASDAGETYEPGGVARGVVDHLTAMGLRVRLDEGLGSPGARTFGQPRLLEALLHCLVQNAHDHGVEDMDVVVAVAATSARVELSVENRIASVKGHNGLGLGLVLCNRLANLLGGELQTATIDDRYCATVRLVRLDPAPTARSPRRAPLPPSRHLHPAGAISV